MTMTPDPRLLVEWLTACAAAMREQNPGRGGFQLVAPHTHWLEEAAATITRLTEERDALRGAVTPNGDTKAAYMGEFSFDVMFPSLDEDDDEPVPHLVPVPWDTIKKIMAAIAARATLARSSDGE